MEVNKERIVEEFVELTSIDSESLNERGMADVLKKKLDELGLEYHEDDVAEKIGGNAGNIYAVLKGDSFKTPILFSSHMDTVKPGIGKKPVLHDDGKITSDGTTVLGADDVSGIVAILEGIRMVKDSGETVGDIEVLFTVCEEVYGQGAANFDYSKVRSKIAYALDLTGEIGIAATKAPSIVRFTARILGKAAHAGFEPEKGLNALKAAAKAISRIEQGSVDGKMINVGTIQSGKANNIVPEECVVSGEVRSFDHDAAIEEVERIGDIFDEEAEALILESAIDSDTRMADRETGRRQGECQFDYAVNIRAFDISHDAEVCQRFQKACNNLGLPGDLVETYGGSDNAFFVEKGIEGIVISSGMHDVHSVNEYTYVDEIAAAAKLVKELILI